MRSKLINKSVRTPLRAALLAGTTALALAASSGAAMATQLFVQNSGTSPAGGDPNILTDPSNFVVGPAGNHSAVNPLLLIVGVLNGNNSTSAPVITFSSGVSSASVGTFGLTTNPASFTSASSGSAFAALGLSAGNSENWSNWSTADSTNGFGTPSSFELFAYALNTSLASSTTVTVGVSGAPNGSYVLAYGCANSPASGVCSNSDILETVFTNTGLIDGRSNGVHAAPEPGSLALLGTGLIGLGFAVRRRRRRT